MRQPDFDIDREIGRQAELWVMDVRKALAEGRVEVKSPKPFLQYGSAYIELECRSQNGVWKSSGLTTTKSELQFLTFGVLPGGLVVDTEWLRKAALVALEAGCTKECTRGSNPTKGVLVGLKELWATRPGEP